MLPCCTKPVQECCAHPASFNGYKHKNGYNTKIWLFSWQQFRQPHTGRGCEDYVIHHWAGIRVHIASRSNSGFIIVKVPEEMWASHLSDTCECQQPNPMCGNLQCGNCGHSARAGCWKSTVKPFWHLESKQHRWKSLHHPVYVHPTWRPLGQVSAVPDGRRKWNRGREGCFRVGRGQWEGRGGREGLHCTLTPTYCHSLTCAPAIYWAGWASTQGKSVPILYACSILVLDTKWAWQPYCISTG